MIQGKSILAIIPARGGSKRLPRKNIMPLSGKPMICWTIEAAQESKYIDTIIVSTEDKEILETARITGVNTMLRPAHLATDTTTSSEVIKHVLESIKTDYDYTILLQATSPLRNSTHIDEACELIVGRKANSIISVSETDHSPLWSNTLPDDGNMIDFIDPAVRNIRSQDLPVYYRINGAIYICLTTALLDEGSFFQRESMFAYFMERDYSIDIDTKRDFKLCELIMSEFNMGAIS